MLPTKPVAANSQNPRRLVLFAHTKVGKTEALSKLPDNFIIDTEQGSDFIEALKIDLIKYCKDNKMNPMQAMEEIGKELDAYHNEHGKYPYKYISVDTTSGIEEFARWYATVMYKATPIGKSFGGKDVVAELPNGGGYDWLRKAFDALLKPIDGKANCVILVAHVKNSSINKMGKDLQAKDLALTGKLKQIVCAGADAIGYMFRNPNNANQTIVSFKTHEQDLATGARPPHLSNQEFVLLELENPDFADKKEPRRFKSYWDKIFI